jgi:hypothetical protein
VKKLDEAILLICFILASKNATTKSPNISRNKTVTGLSPDMTAYTKPASPVKRAVRIRK